MPRNRLQIAAQGLLIGLLIGYLIARLQSPSLPVWQKERLRRLNRMFIRTVYENARFVQQTPEDESHASDEG